jgi:hypothetical protein
MPLAPASAWPGIDERHRQERLDAVEARFGDHQEWLRTSIRHIDAASDCGFDPRLSVRDRPV